MTVQIQLQEADFKTWSYIWNNIYISDELPPVIKIVKECINRCMNKIRFYRDTKSDYYNKIFIC